MNPIYVGPEKLPCVQQCEVPGGMRVGLVPQSRHAWSDVVNCPNEGCGQAVLLLDAVEIAEGGE